jgi:hypothetical protein
MPRYWYNRNRGNHQKTIGTEEHNLHFTENFSHTFADQPDEEYFRHSTLQPATPCWSDGSTSPVPSLSPPAMTTMTTNTAEEDSSNVSHQFLVNLIQLSKLNMTSH